jgi:hypothetical protein
MLQNKFSYNNMELLPEFESIFNNEFESLYPELEFEAKPVNVSNDSVPYIKWVQESLNKILNLKLLVDGDNGKNTRDAIKRFQSDNGLQQVGYVGPKTEAALIKANALLTISPTSSPTSSPTTSTPTCSPTKALPASMSTLLVLIDALLKKIPLLGYSGIVIPSDARFLDCREETLANTIFGNSLDYSRIIITDGLGFSGRAFTIVIQISGKFYVIMMLGTSPLDDTLIHELTHAWQSQHHGSDPQAFMWAAVKCQLMALADIPLAKSSAAAIAYSKIIPSIVTNDLFKIAAATKASAAAAANEDTSAYAYIPGFSFEMYGAEQIAQLIEDYSESNTMHTNFKKNILDNISSLKPNVRSLLNEKSLAVIRFNRKSEPNVIWH